MPSPTYKAISAHNELAEKPALLDELLINDVSAGETKKVKYEKLVDLMVYNNLMIEILEKDEELSVASNLWNMPVLDDHDGKKAVKLTAYLSGSTSSSGNVNVRLYNVTKTAEVGTVTVTAGQVLGKQSIDYALSEDDVLRVDITGAGTGAHGLLLIIKVNTE